VDNHCPNGAGLDACNPPRIFQKEYQMISVIFIHDDNVSKWEIFVNGTTDITEARQAFNAVLLTCRDTKIQVGLKHIVVPTPAADSHEIIPEVKR
jgi:hypothetical protein